MHYFLNLIINTFPEMKLIKNSNPFDKILKILDLKQLLLSPKLPSNNCASYIVYFKVLSTQDNLLISTIYNPR